MRGLLFGLLLAGALSQAQAQVRSSANYAIGADSVGGGGGTSASANYVQQGSVSIAFATPPMVGTNYRMSPGLLPMEQSVSLSVAPPALAFGNQAVGTSSPGQAVTLTNGGNAAVSLTSISLIGANPLDFSQSNACGSSLAVGASCVVNVFFAPQSLGAKGAALAVTSNSPGSPQLVSLSGTGTGTAGLGVSPGLLTFGAQAVGTSSAAQPVTVQNNGSAPATFSSIATTGDFTQTNNCGSTLAASASCTVSVTFSPAANGTRTGTLTISSNDPAGPQSVSLSGVGGVVIAPALVPGFNLVGNGTTSALNVAAFFGSVDAPVSGVTSNIDAVWAWDAATGTWMFHTPQLTAAQSAAYATTHGFEPLTSIAAGRGYWVSALVPFTLAMPAGAPFTYGLVNFSVPPLAHGFNLLSIGGTMSPSQFNVNVGAPPAPGTVPNNFNALWAWDAVRQAWYFYTPQFEQAGSPFTNCSYTASQHFLDFGGCAPANAAPSVPGAPAPALNLQPGLGFWVDLF